MNDQISDLNTDEGEFVKQSNVEGFTVVKRANKRPRVHLLRPYESCNVDDATSKERIDGSREELLIKFGKVVACQRCFPGPNREERALAAEPAMDDDPQALAADLADEFEIGPESIREGYTDERVGDEEAEG